MIEQTELIVSQWHYNAPLNSSLKEIKISNTISLDVMKKRAGVKKGIACRFTCVFNYDKEILLQYVAEDSYVIDLADTIDKSELLIMIRNSYSKFKERFDLRKYGTAVQNKSLIPLNETSINLDVLLRLLQ